jgi:hypothetical protein
MCSTVDGKPCRRSFDAMTAAASRSAKRPHSPRLLPAVMPSDRETDRDFQAFMRKALANY